MTGTMRLFLLLALFAFPVAAEEIRFDVGMRGVRAAQMVFRGDVTESTYVVSGSMQGTGLIGALVEINYAGEAQGRVRNGRLRTRTVTLRDQMGDERGTTSLRWSGGTPEVTASPGFPREDYDIDAAEQRGSIDTLTALFDVLRTQPTDGICNWTTPMFDGRRASRLSVGQPQADGETIRCNAEYVRVAGFEPEEMAERTRYAFTVTYAPAGDDMMQAIEMRAATKYGDAVLRRR